MKQNTLRKLISLGMIAVLAIFFTLKSPYFLTASNLSAIVRDSAVAGIAGIGLTYVILTAGIDLSTGSVMALAGMVMANIYTYTLIPIPVMILAGLAVGLVCGAINGFVVTKLKLPEFIATLATMGIYRSLTYVIAVRDSAGSIQSVQMRASSFTVLGSGVGGLYWVVLALVGQFLLKKTRFGTNLYAVGSNFKAAQLSGINDTAVTILAYVLSGLTTAMGGIVLASMTQQCMASTGSGYENYVIMSAVIGGVSLLGGVGTVPGCVFGAILIGLLNNGLNLMSVPSTEHDLVKGIVIIAAVAFDALQHQDKARSWLRQFRFLQKKEVT
ncbi:ABC transporter permease [uncultured Subdoligranulum sp.]|uniref:ABC transporter permease n=1 Tax=uncultured Subdoligranulum sp. TaxID=512298 RepID=UPI0025F03810|nr:ABC transporter permease [uncultured Subdoligranulum sp.]